MQRNLRLFLALQRDIWFIDPAYAEAQLPMIGRLLAGQGRGAWVDDDDDDDDEEGGGYFAIHANSATPFQASRYRSFNEAPAGSIAVFSVSGPILKYGYCGDTGSMALAAMLQEAAASPNIMGGVMQFDSPGGQVEGLATVRDAQTAFRATGKKLLGLVQDGMAASAALYMAAGCDELYVSHATSRVGSIGVVATLTDSSESDKARGMKRVQVYATRSTDKNKDYRDALAGNTAALKKELDVHAEDFIAVVTEGRGDRLNLEAGDPFTGKMYFGPEAEQLGLIDGQKSFADVVARVQELSTSASPAPAANLAVAAAPAASPEPNISHNSTAMAHTRLLALLGLSTAMATTKDGTHLQPAHLDAIEKALEEKETAATALTTANQTIATHGTTLDAMTKRAEKAEADLAQRAAPATAAAAPVQQSTDRPAPETPAAEVDPELQAVLELKASLGIPNE